MRDNRSQRSHVRKSSRGEICTATVIGFCADEPASLVSILICTCFRVKGFVVAMPKYA